MKIKKFFSKLKTAIQKLFDDEKLNDFYDVIKFIVIHGTMGMFALFVIISIIGIDFTIVDYIRNSVKWSAIVFLLGSGSLYYLFLDVNKYLKDTWGKNRQ